MAWCPSWKARRRKRARVPSAPDHTAGGGDRGSPAWARSAARVGLGGWRGALPPLLPQSPRAPRARVWRPPGERARRAHELHPGWSRTPRQGPGARARGRRRGPRGGRREKGERPPPPPPGMAIRASCRGRLPACSVSGRRPPLRGPLVSLPGHRPSRACSPRERVPFQPRTPRVLRTRRLHPPLGFKLKFPGWGRQRTLRASPAPSWRKPRPHPPPGTPRARKPPRAGHAPTAKATPPAPAGVGRGAFPRGSRGSEAQCPAAGARFDLGATLEIMTASARVRGVLSEHPGLKCPLNF